MRTQLHVFFLYVPTLNYESLYSKAGFIILALAVFHQAQEVKIGKKILQGLWKKTKKDGYGFIRS